MRRFRVLGVGLAGLLGVAGCGDDGGSGGGGQGGDGTGGAASTTSTTGTGSTTSTGSNTTSSSSSGGGQGGGTAGGGQGGGGGAGGGGSDVWVRVANDPNTEGVTDLAETSDGGVVFIAYLVGTSDFGGGEVVSQSGDIIVGKYAVDGTHVFTKHFGGLGNDYPEQLALGPNDEIYVTGYVGDDVDFGGGTLTVGGNSDAFLLALEADGDHVWSKVFGDSSNADRGWGVGTSASGLVVMTGMFDGTVDFGGGDVTSSDLDGFVAAFDDTGDFQYANAFEAGSFPYAGGVAVDDDGNAYLSGYFEGTLSFGGITSAGMKDAFLVKLDDTGAVTWAKAFGGADDEFGSQVALDGLGNVVQAGNLSGSADFGGGTLTTAGLADVFVARFDSDGDHVSSMRFGDADDQFVSGLRARSDGAIILGGHFNGTITVDGVTLTSSPGQDGYWIVLDDMNEAVDGRSYRNSDGNKILGVDFSGTEAVFVGGDYGVSLAVEDITLAAGNADYYSAFWGRIPLAN